jgi:hypothetical protein
LSLCILEFPLRSRDWPRFKGEVLGHVARTNERIQHHKEVYLSLIVEHLKRVLLERYLPENIMEKIQLKTIMEEV